MSKKIYIDTTHSTETRIAVTEDGKLDDFEIESNKKNSVKGDVYLAKITRVEPSLQAAFVDFGANRNGFLPLTEIHPDYFKIPSADEDKLQELNDKLSEFHKNSLEETEDNNDNMTNSSDEDNDEDKNKSNIIKTRKNNPKKDYINFFRKYKIQDVIRPRQVILVQINKEERGLKGAALTTFLSFAGRYCVLMPNSMNSDGISRKIGDIEERKKLKQILSTVNIPERMSVIVRTAGIGKSKKEISKDFTFLLKQWNSIRETTLKSEAPKLIYEEGNILKRTVRDLLTDEIDTIQVEGKEGYDRVKKFAKNLVPSLVKKIKQHKTGKNSLFVDNKIESQINELFSLSVKLPSGGSIVINTTEALVAIDVNSGKNTSERNIESTALKTNLEAASEIARQLRLRDLGGLIVIDFIDMDDYRNNFKVEKTIKTALIKDRARVQIGRISMFGLLELSRQRLKTSLIDRSFETCHYCKGSGLILKDVSIGDQIIKVIKEKLSNTKGDQIKIIVKCNTSLADTIINSKKIELLKLEKDYNANINFLFNNQYSLHEPSVDAEEIIEEEQKTSKLKIKKKIIRKKKNIIAKEKKIKSVKKSKNSSEIKIDEKDGSSEINVEEKTGWWS